MHIIQIYCIFVRSGSGSGPVLPRIPGQLHYFVILGSINPFQKVYRK